MEFEFDPAKDARNLAERGLSLALAPLVFEDLVYLTDDVAMTMGNIDKSRSDA